MKKSGRRAPLEEGNVMGRDYGARRGRRALILVEDLPVPFDRRVWAEAKTLRDAGWDVAVISPQGPGASTWHERADGIEVYRYPLPATGSGLASHALEYAIAVPATLVLALLALARFKGRIDVVHACNPPDFLFPIGLILKASGSAFLFDQHDLGPELYAAQGGRVGGLVDRILKWAERRTYRSADAVIATNESYRRVALERGGTDPARVFVVRSSPDPSRLHPVPPSAELRDGRSGLVVYLGTMGRQDGVDLFVRAAAVIAAERPGEVRFVAIGSGDQRDSLEAQAAELGLGQDLTFTGRLPDAEVRRYLATADVGVSPDPKNGFNELCTMNKTLEYMAMGLPTAAFDLEETRVSAGDAAIYAMPNDPRELASAILALIDDPERRAEMGRLGRERIAGPLSWSVSAGQLLAAYEAALAARREGRAPRPTA
jgi:glycosyltransferase involved in cell wall biosynthesis